MAAIFNYGPSQTTSAKLEAVNFNKTKKLAKQVTSKYSHLGTKNMSAHDPDPLSSDAPIDPVHCSESSSEGEFGMGS